MLLSTTPEVLSAGIECDVGKNGAKTTSNSIHGGDSLLGDSGGGAAQHWAYFTSSAGAAVVVGLPLVLYHNRVIEGGAALMDIAGCLLLCATVGLGVAFHREGDGDALFG